MCVGKIKHVYVNMNTVSVLNCFNDNKMEKTGRERERVRKKFFFKCFGNLDKRKEKQEYNSRW